MAFSGVGCASQPPFKGACYLVHLIGARRPAVRLVQKPKHVRSAAISGQIGRPRDHMEMDVAKALCLRELHDVRLHAACHRMQRSRKTNLPAAQPGGLRIGQVRDGEHMTTRKEHQPAK